jgi:hypothetical protein
VMHVAEEAAEACTEDDVRAMRRLEEDDD